MTKRLSAKKKCTRSLQCNIWGAESSSFAKRPHKPGERYAQSIPKKQSNYGLQLSAKQRLRAHYGNIVEKQFRNTFAEAVRLRGDTSKQFISLLERRLDVLVYRMKFAPTIFAARQLVNHCHITVNGRRLNIASYKASIGEIAVKESSHNMMLIINAFEDKNRDIPPYITMEAKGLKGKLTVEPELEVIPYPIKIEPHLIAEWYSRRMRK
jgi:small subunit ribosomal protein S4